MRLEIFGVEGLAEIQEGDDLAELIAGAADLADGDVVVVTQKIVSKAEGAMAVVDPDDPLSHKSVVEQESVRVLRRRDDLVISETKHGFVCANAGVDKSNVRPGSVVLLPIAPDKSARRIRARLLQAFGVTVGVIITDTFGRAWRHGLTDVAIGVAGLPAVVDYRGTTDTYGNTLEVTEVALADELAAAADLVMGKAKGIPAALVRGVEHPPGEGSSADLVRSPTQDMFR